LSSSSFIEHLELSLGNMGAKSHKWMRGGVEGGYLGEKPLGPGQPVPETSSILLLGAGLVCFAAWQLRRMPF
jgi:hypothetical protein